MERRWSPLMQAHTGRWTGHALQRLSGSEQKAASPDKGMVVAKGFSPLPLHHTCSPACHPAAASPQHLSCISVHTNEVLKWYHLQCCQLKTSPQTLTESRQALRAAIHLLQDDMLRCQGTHSRVLRGKHTWLTCKTGLPCTFRIERTASD